MEKKTDSSYQPLFDHMHQGHSLTLLESEMADIIHLVEKMQQGKPQGAIWVKVSERLPTKEYNYHVRATTKFQGYNHNDTAFWRNGKWEFDRENGREVIEWLDESVAPAKECDVEKQTPEWVEWLCDRSPDVPDLSDSTEEEKKLLVDTLFQSAGIQFMKMFYAVGLEKFMESGLVNDSTGDLFRLRFELLQKGHKQEQKETKP